MKALSALCLIALAAPLMGCISPQDRALRNSQPYQAGYADGCAAANTAGASFRDGPVRNTEAFRTNKAYRAGWNTGYSVCRQSINMPGSEPGHPIPEPSPGH